MSSNFLCRYWRGTDAHILVEMPPKISFKFKMFILLIRIYVKLTEPLYSLHHIDGENLREKLTKFGINVDKIKYLPDSISDFELNRKKSNNFTVLYYIPDVSKKNNPEFVLWQYGYDVFIKVEAWLRINIPNCDIIYWNGQGGEKQLKEYLEKIDIYIRCNNWDSESRLVRACRKYNIPYYHSQEKPNCVDITEKIKTVLFCA